MPSNKNFQVRIEILDELLSSPKKRKTQELMDELNKKLYDNGYSRIGRHTFFDDLAYLESKLGAPLKRATKSDPFICYSEKFSIKNIPIEEEDVNLLRQAIEILKKATDLNINQDIDEVVTRLENKVHTNLKDRGTIIAFEEHTKAIGQEHLDDLFNAIVTSSTVRIKYQPFAKDEKDWVVSPYMLKQYRNRWFLIGRVMGNKTPVNIALDRIKTLKNSKEPFEVNDLFDPDTYFNNLIGVSFPEEKKIETVIIQVSSSSANYILTKPIHKSQEVIQKFSDGSLKIAISVYLNYELKSHLLSYGPNIEVLEPSGLRNDIKSLFEQGISLYN